MRERVLLRFAAVLATACLAASVVVGQTVPTVPEPVQINDLPRRFLVDELRLWTSPFRKGPQRAQTIRKYVLPFALLSGTLIATDRQTGRLLPNSRDQLIWSGRVSQLGASYSLAGMAGGAYLLGKITANEHAREAGLIGLEALGHTQIVVFALKQATNRERPLDHDGSKGGFWDGGNSFPSGHAAGAFAVATVFAHEYHDHLAAPSRPTRLLQPFLPRAWAPAATGSRTSRSAGHWDS